MARDPICGIRVDEERAASTSNQLGTITAPQTASRFYFSYLTLLDPVRSVRHQEVTLHAR